MFYFDPIYFVFIAPGLLLAMWASWRVQSNFSYYSKVPAQSGASGAEAARFILDRAGLHDVKVVAVEGQLSDHYNPADRTLALSQGVYDGRSVAAIGIAAHETGHALQHAHNYWPLWVRSALVPTANIGSTLGYLVMAIGLFLSPFVVILGAIIFSTVLAFQLITLPVEFDATARAKRIALSSGLVGPSEREGMDKVLNAAALTYVAACISTLMVMLYYLFRSGVIGGRD